MQILYTANHADHQPPSEIFNGEIGDHAEVPSRVENILTALRAENYALTPVENVTDREAIMGVLHHIHDANYLDWFEHAQPTEPIYPSVFNFLSQNFQHGHLSIQYGNFCTDLFTPLMPKTWEVALTTAQAMYSASQSIMQNPHEIVTVIGRPPGHHAGRSRIGGYCYLNNVAMIAQVLSAQGRVAILDVDYHHGNGTQDIFYDRGDVLTCSIHADPMRKFPYFAGMADEEGEGHGQGSNRNFPLPAGITNDQYQPVLETAVEWIRNEKPHFLIVALGLDTHESDPIADFKLTTEYYQRMAETIHHLNLPTIIVLEGGYSTDAIGANMASFLRGMA